MKQVEGNGKSTWTQLMNEETYMEGAINQLASLNFEGKKTLRMASIKLNLFKHISSITFCQRSFPIPSLRYDGRL